jgi:hypothetical protein
LRSKELKVETGKTKHECEFFGTLTSLFNADARRKDYDYRMKINQRHCHHRHHRLDVQDTSYKMQSKKVEDRALYFIADQTLIDDLAFIP